MHGEPNRRAVSLAEQIERGREQAARPTLAAVLGCDDDFRDVAGLLVVERNEVAREVAVGRRGDEDDRRAVDGVGEEGRIRLPETGLNLAQDWVVLWTCESNHGRTTTERPAPTSAPVRVARKLTP